MNILVIGGCGFIGSHIVDELLLAGHEVSVFGHSPEAFRPPLSSVTYFFGDLLNIDRFRDVIKSSDIVIHAASSTNPASSHADPETDVKSNLIGMIRLLECMNVCNKKRIVFLSSGGTVYGLPSRLPIPEQHSLNPQCSYATVKLAMEHYLGIYSRLYDFKTTIIRPANPYGPRQGFSSSQGVIANFTAKALRHEPLTLWGSGNTVRDFFHVNDLAKLCVQAIEKNPVGIFNAGSGRGHSITEVIQILESIHGTPLHVRQLEPRDFDIPEVVLDIRKVKHDLQWTPVIELQQGMTDYHKWLQLQLAIREKTTS